MDGGQRVARRSCFEEISHCLKKAPRYEGLFLLTGINKNIGRIVGRNNMAAIINLVGL